MRTSMNFSDRFQVQLSIVFCSQIWKPVVCNIQVNIIHFPYIDLSQNVKIRDVPYSLKGPRNSECKLAHIYGMNKGKVFSVLLFVSLMVFNATFSLAQYLFSTGYARLVDFHTVKLHVQTNNRNNFYLFFEKYITRKSHKFSNSKNTYIIVIHNVPQNTSNCHDRILLNPNSRQ
jgi:hypothetical protein